MPCRCGTELCLIFFIVAGVAKNMIACISTAVQKSADDTFIIHKHMKECSMKGLITNSTRPSMFMSLKKYIYIAEL